MEGNTSVHTIQFVLVMPAWILVLFLTVN